MSQIDDLLHRALLRNDEVPPDVVPATDTPGPSPSDAAQTALQTGFESAWWEQVDG